MERDSEGKIVITDGTKSEDFYHEDIVYLGLPVGLLTYGFKRFKIAHIRGIRSIGRFCSIAPDACVPGLYPVATPRLEALARLLKDCDTKTVCYLRPQSEFIQSYYLQTVKMGNSTPFSKWYGGLNIESLSWEPLVSCMRKLFGAEKSCIEDFRSIQNGVDKFIESFAKNCRIQLQLKKPKNVFQNLSLGKKGLEIALLVNPLLKGHELQKMRFFLETNFSIKHYSRAVLLSLEDIEKLRSLWMPEYDYLLSDRSYIKADNCEKINEH